MPPPPPPRRGTGAAGGAAASKTATTTTNTNTNTNTPTQPLMAKDTSGAGIGIAMGMGISIINPGTAVAAPGNNKEAAASAAALLSPSTTVATTTTGVCSPTSNSNNNINNPSPSSPSSASSGMTMVGGTGRSGSTDRSSSSSSMGAGLDSASPTLLPPAIVHHWIEPPLPNHVASSDLDASAQPARGSAAAAAASPEVPSYLPQKPPTNRQPQQPVDGSSKTSRPRPLSVEVGRTPRQADPGSSKAFLSLPRFGRSRSERSAGSAPQQGKRSFETDLSDISDELNGSSQVSSSEQSSLKSNAFFDLVSAGKVEPKSAGTPPQTPAAAAGSVAPFGGDDAGAAKLRTNGTQALAEFLRTTGPSPSSPLPKAKPEPKKPRGFAWFRPKQSKRSADLKGRPKSPPPPIFPRRHVPLTVNPSAARVHPNNNTILPPAISQQPSSPTSSSSSQLPSAAELARYDSAKAIERQRIQQQEQEQELSRIQAEVQGQLDQLNLSKQPVALGGPYSPVRNALHEPGTARDRPSAPPARDYDDRGEADAEDSPVRRNPPFNAESLRIDQSSFMQFGLSKERQPWPSAHTTLPFPPPPTLPITNDENVLHHYDQSLRLYQSFMQQQQQHQQQIQQMQRLMQQNIQPSQLPPRLAQNFYFDPEGEGEDDDDGGETDDQYFDDEDTDLDSEDEDEEVRANTKRNAVVTRVYPRHTISPDQSLSSSLSSSISSAVVVPVQHHFHHHHHHHHFYHGRGSSTGSVRIKRRNSKGKPGPSRKRVNFRNSVEQLTPVTVLLSSVSRAGGLQSNVVRKTAGGGAMLVPADALRAVRESSLFQVSDSGVGDGEFDDESAGDIGSSDDTETEDEDAPDPENAPSLGPTGALSIIGADGGNDEGESDDATEEDEAMMHAVTVGTLKPEDEDREDLRPGDVIASGEISPLSSDEANNQALAYVEPTPAEDLMFQRSAGSDATDPEPYDAQPPTASRPSSSASTILSASTSPTLASTALSPMQGMAGTPLMPISPPVSPSLSRTPSGTPPVPNHLQSIQSSYPTPTPSPPVLGTPISPPPSSSFHSKLISGSNGGNTIAEYPSPPPPSSAKEQQLQSQSPSTSALSLPSASSSDTPHPPPLPPRRVRHVLQQTKRVDSAAVAAQTNAADGQDDGFAAKAAAAAAERELGVLAQLAVLRAELARARVEADVARAVVEGLTAEVARGADEARRRQEGYDEKSKGIMVQIRRLVEEKSAIEAVAVELRERVQAANKYLADKVAAGETDAESSDTRFHSGLVPIES
ncbi:hypothetical protein DFJ73DRAFT_908932 [Zopfochytrium polystomum]|nr:hypothetical protein DFJ73DRAFT_908932 [Zopfochytrium polystomum]